jgi:hypothetical protein
MTSWRYTWQYFPIFRFYIYSIIIVIGLFKFLVPRKSALYRMSIDSFSVKPHHKIVYAQGKENQHHHEIEFWSGFRQRLQDQEYFKKYDPFRKAGAPDVGGH